MSIFLSITEAQVNKALRSFLLGAITPPPTGFEAVIAQVNRVPEPKSRDFVVITPLRRMRLATNTDRYVDARFIGSVAGSVMAISDVSYGSLAVGSVIFGVDVATGTTVTGTLTGTGGTGTYTVSPPQTLGSRVLAAGVAEVLQPTEVTVQLDVHGPSSADIVQTISTLVRDDYGVEAFRIAGYDGITPLYTSDPVQMPFINGENQYEYRWVVEVALEADPIVMNIPQQFAEHLDDIILVVADNIIPA